MERNLGISEEDSELLHNNVQIFYHCAATIRFDEPLRSAVLLNARGTKYALEFAKKMNKLEVFFHCEYFFNREKVIISTRNVVVLRLFFTQRNLHT